MTVMPRLVAAAATLIVLGTPAAHAVTEGLISTDRFGYTGTIERFATLDDAKTGTNATDTIAVGDRDLSLYFSSGQGSDANIAMGSWWYTTSTNGAGWGNVNGNTGVGFMQLYDDDGSTDLAIDMSFSNFDGTYWRDFNFSATLEDAGADDYARLSAYDNVNDGGIYHSFQIDLTATGLEGVANGGLIESLGPHPTGVSGSMQGVFELTENQTSAADQGFYRFYLDLTMDNWAWENRDDLVGTQFYPSGFIAAAVPLPAPALMLLTAFGLAGAMRMKTFRRG